MLLTLLVFLTLADQNEMRFISILHSLFGQTVRFENANDSLSKKWMQGTKESHFFDSPKLGTPPKLEALTVLL